jgi:hypothetical protein
MAEYQTTTGHNAGRALGTAAMAERQATELVERQAAAPNERQAAVEAERQAMTRVERQVVTLVERPPDHESIDQGERRNYRLLA